MYVYKRQVVTYQGIATLLTLALVLWGVGIHMFTQTAEAANLTDVSDLLTNSAPSESSVHTITFTTPNGMVTGADFTIDFPAGFDLSTINVAGGDITLSNGGVVQTVAAAAGAATWRAIIGGDNSITFRTPTDGGVASSTELIITIGEEAGNMVTNPAVVTSYQVAIGNTSFSASSTITDGGYARVAIVDDVDVSAQILTTLTFTVAGVGDNASVNGTSTTDVSTGTTLPFGTLNSGEIKTMAQRLNLSTNAANGYVVTVEQDGELESSTGAVIDGFINGSWTQTPSAWQAPGNNVADPTTWGHWGLTSTDDDTIARTLAGDTEFGSNQWVSGSTTPIVIMGHNAPSDGVTNGVGSTTVGYQIQTTALQEAGDDYNTTLTYIATPTF